jgi:hypothetical protein
LPHCPGRQSTFICEPLERDRVGVGRQQLVKRLEFLIKLDASLQVAAKHRVALGPHIFDRWTVRETVSFIGDMRQLCSLRSYSDKTAAGSRHTHKHHNMIQFDTLTIQRIFHDNTRSGLDQGGL